MMLCAQGDRRRTESHLGVVLQRAYGVESERESNSMPLRCNGFFCLFIYFFALEQEKAHYFFLAGGNFLAGN